MATPRYDHYQTAEKLIVSVYQKGLKAEEVEVKAEERSVKIFNNGELLIELGPLAQATVPEQVTHKVFGTKLELIIPKAMQGINWPSLISSSSAPTLPPPTTLAAAPPSPAAPSPPSSKPKKKDWSKIVEEDLNKDGKKDESIEEFFQKLYSSVEPEARRAMIKSYTESGGTTLSTNWADIGSKTTPTQPPEGMEAKKI